MKRSHCSHSKTRSKRKITAKDTAHIFLESFHCSPCFVAYDSGLYEQALRILQKVRPTCVMICSRTASTRKKSTDAKSSHSRPFAHQRGSRMTSPAAVQQ